MINVTVRGSDGEVRHLQGAVGTTLMQVAYAAKVPGILAECGGGCSCATCHVQFAPDWYARLPQPELIEAGMLASTPKVIENSSRLSCQIRLTEALDGLTCSVPE